MLRHSLQSRSDIWNLSPLRRQNDAREMLLGSGGSIFHILEHCSDPLTSDMELPAMSLDFGFWRQIDQILKYCLVYQVSEEHQELQYLTPLL